ncbi:glycine zipper 2TM domain-containing protein [Altererythrobacter sp. GH1-8]|uniref:glycine zipper 2TM domain-containing protein n=1 Tax=Altererythrobacter sp. GH1-8 TaxID=3349333 RepID=UPI00374DB476
MPFTQAKQVVLALGATATLSIAAPAAAVDFASPASQVSTASVLGDMTYEHKRKKWKDRDYDDRYYGRDRYHGEPVYRDTRVWRGRDGRYYCRKENGTTGLLIGAGVGALAGNELAGRGDKTLGAILGAAGGAILGRAIDRSNSRCR